MAVFTKIKLDCFVFGYPTAALDHSPTLAVGAELDLAIEELAALGPGYVVAGFESLVI